MSHLDLQAVRDRLGRARGREYWRSLEEAADSPAILEMLQREFPAAAAAWTAPVDRRQFLRLMGASLALAGLGACTRQPDEAIVPYVRRPEDIVPGRPLFYATAMELDGYATGLLVESHAGRPTKIEGNPAHPASLGGTDVFAQASILSLYDPDRAQAVTWRGQTRSWDELAAEVRTLMGPILEQRGAGLRILTGAVGSPTLETQLQQLLAALPEARWHHYAPINADNDRAGSRLAFGGVVERRFRLDHADVILSLDADLLGTFPGAVRYARDFSGRRRPGPGSDAPPMNRLYVIESTPTTTGARADHRLPLRQGQIAAFARALALAIASGGPAPLEGLPAQARRWLDAVVEDLARHRGSSLVVAGPAQPPVVHALAHLVNEALGNHGATVDYLDVSPEPDGSDAASLRELAEDMDAGRVSLLVIIGTNPAFTAPADLRFAERMAGAARRIAMSDRTDETAALADWHVPQAHYLEGWSDTRAFDGTASIVQPLIAPLYDSRSPHELLALLAGEVQPAAYDLVRRHWQGWFAGPAAGALEPGLAFEPFWRRALHDGVVPGTARPTRAVTVDADAVLAAPIPTAPEGMELTFRPDPSLHDGRFANNGWLQELPRPFTKLTWDNALLVSPRTAERLGVEPRVAFQGGEHGQTLAPVVELTQDGRSLRVPAWITPGQADDCLTLHLGQGRTHAGQVGSGVGVNANLLRTSTAPWGGDPVGVVVTGERVPLASTQAHHSMEGRDLVRRVSLAEYRNDPDAARRGLETGTDGPTLYPARPSEGYAWGMTIDLGACTGCNACIVACQAENNIPVVGKDEVLRGREMHWLRVDRYYTGPLDEPDTHFQPVPCMHCENAPCEPVCPVAATVHSSEGLNEMVYNRCIGTRYCSNNCPYKVRRFNFHLYADWDSPVKALVHNPDVSVRSRGVMEKCTYCVQRISAARIGATREGRPVRDGDIVTACEAVCPTSAIVFGDINDPDSRVSLLKRDARNYGLLADLGTRPRTTYLADVRNLNPDLDEPS